MTRYRQQSNHSTTAYALDEIARQPRIKRVFMLTYRTIRRYKADCNGYVALARGQ